MRYFGKSIDIFIKSLKKAACILGIPKKTLFERRKFIADVNIKGSDTLKICIIISWLSSRGRLFYIAPIMYVVQVYYVTKTINEEAKN